MNCKFCGEPLPPNANGNRRYCDESCYMAEKLIRSKNNYEVNKNTLNQIKLVEKILASVYNKYGSNVIDVNILRVEKMNWSVMTGKITIDGEIFRLVGRYGYILYTDNTIKIIKL